MGSGESHRPQESNYDIPQKAQPQKRPSNEGSSQAWGGRRREEEMEFTGDEDCVTPVQHC